MRAAALLAARRRREEAEARHLPRLTGRPTGNRSRFHLSTLESAWAHERRFCTVTHESVVLGSREVTSDF